MTKMEPHINTSNMTIQEVAVDAVTPYEKNPRKIPQEAIDRVAASIKEFGFKQPIVVDKDMVIIVGHTRLLAAKKLGYETVPVLVASDLSPEKARAYRLADNKTNESQTGISRLCRKSWHRSCLSRTSTWRTSASI